MSDEQQYAGGGTDVWGETLGLEFVEVSQTRVVATLEAGPQHHQPYGILHGGVYCSIVEGVASYGAGQVSHARGEGVVGVSNQTDFLRSHSEGASTSWASPSTSAAPSRSGRSRSRERRTESSWRGGRSASQCCLSCPPSGPRARPTRLLDKP